MCRCHDLVIAFVEMVRCFMGVMRAIPYYPFARACVDSSLERQTVCGGLM
jgi:hypothetical protein